MNTKGFFIDKLENNEGYNVVFMKEEQSLILQKLQTKYPNYKLTKCNSNISLVSSKAKEELISYDLIIFKSCTDYNIYASERIRTLVKKIAILRKKPTTGAYQYMNNDKIEIKVFFDYPNESSQKLSVLSQNFNDMDLLDVVASKHYDNITKNKKNIFMKIKK